MHKLYLNFKKFVSVSRYNKPHGILLLFYPCIWGISFSDKNILEVFYLCIIFFLGSCGMRAVGCIWNDVSDKKFDILVDRTKKRLIAKGAISTGETFLYIIINLLLGMLPIFFLNKFSIVLCLIVIPLVVTYPYMKRITWWPQLWLGINFNWGVLIGFYSLTEPSFNIAVVIFYLGCIFLTIAYDTIYGFQDIKDDLKLGIKSTAIKFKDFPKLFLAFNYISCFLCWTLSLYLFNANIIILFLLAVFFSLIITNSVAIQLENPLSCEKSFKKNSYFSLAVTLLLIYNNFLNT